MDCKGLGRRRSPLSLWSADGCPEDRRGEFRGSIVYTWRNCMTRIGAQNLEGSTVIVLNILPTYLLARVSWQGHRAFQPKVLRVHKQRARQNYVVGVYELTNVSHLRRYRITWTLTNAVCREDALELVKVSGYMRKFGNRSTMVEEDHAPFLVLAGL